ncbi:MAG: Asp-tRNA(Asn)/Glu-tRNA(Gln) amidotransferase subunit GatC [Chloroflexi bacterium]|nr:Asp-tRNA(Asn)/Glu-tRNA(Gln) amidotransferase subunit GatC [Chloroflexota bacterium]
MKLSHEEARRIALLARVGITEAEAEKLREQLSNILENFEILQEVDTTNVLPTAQVTGLENVVREDESAPSLSQKEILTNAPREEEGFFRIKAVLE